MRLTYLLLSLATGACALATGCDSEALDPTERALRGITTSLRGVDDSVENATGFSFFAALRGRVEDELVPYDDGRWVFPAGRGVVMFRFEEDGGAPQQFPNARTDGMEISYGQSLDAGWMLDTVGDPTATETTTTATHGLSRAPVSVSVAYGLEVVHDLEGVELAVAGELEAEVAFGGPCPVGEISGSVTASADVPLQPRVSRTLEVVGRYDGADLVWEAWDGDTLLDEGRTPARAASGC